MSDTLIVRDDEGPRFSWSLALAGAAVAVAVSFLLLMLGSGVGLLLVRPDTMPTHFLTGGAIYFLAAQAFGFAVGGHVAGRLLGPLPRETQFQEEIRAAIHGLVVWAVAIIATLILVGVAGAATAALYGVSKTAPGVERTAPLAVDRLFRPGPAPTIPAPGITPSTAVPSDTGAATTENPPPVTVTPVQAPDPVHARAEADRLIEADFAPGAKLDAEDRARLVQLTAEQAQVSVSAARLRVAAMESRLTAESAQAADKLRKLTSTTALWLAFALLFGAGAAMVAAVTARLEDDHETAWSLVAFHRGWRE